MTGPVEFEFEGRFRSGPVCKDRRTVSIDVVTFGCRLNAYESEVDPRARRVRPGSMTQSS